MQIQSTFGLIHGEGEVLATIFANTTYFNVSSAKPLKKFWVVTKMYESKILEVRCALSD